MVVEQTTMMKQNLLQVCTTVVLFTVKFTVTYLHKHMH